MNRLRAMNPCRVLGLTAILFGAMVTTLPLPAYGQQEVDPTWYNPWPAANTAVVHSQPQAAVQRRQAVLKPVSTAHGTPKLRVKRATTQTAAVIAQIAK